MKYSLKSNIDTQNSHVGKEMHLTPPSFWVSKYISMLDFGGVCITRLQELVKSNCSPLTLPNPKCFKGNLVNFEGVCFVRLGGGFNFFFIFTPTWGRFPF